MSVEEAAKTASSGFMPWVPWIAGVVVAGLVGGGIGLSGLVGHDTQNVVEFGAIGVSKTTPAYSCPGGVAVATLNRGERVLALSRNDDASWVSVRDPRAIGTTVWVPVGLVVVDDGEGAVSDLPLGDPCPTVSLPPGLVEEAPPAPAPGPGPAPAPVPTDTTAPVISAGTFSPNPVYGTQANQGGCPTSTTVSITATDDVGIASVTGTTTAGPAGAQITQISHSGSTYVFKYQIDYEGGSTGAIIGFTATDAAGNQAIAYAGLQVRPGHYTNCWLG